MENLQIFTGTNTPIGLIKPKESAAKLFIMVKLAQNLIKCTVFAPLATNGWRYVFGLPCMAYRVTTTAIGKLKYTACYLLGCLISR